MRRRYSEKETWCNQLYNVLEDNLLVTVVVLHERFGFGEKRLMEFVDAVQETAAKFSEMIRDEVIDEKTDSYRHRYQQAFRGTLRATTENFMPDAFIKAIFGHTPTKREIEREVKIKTREKQKTAVTLSEAAELQAKMQAFGDFLKDKGAKKDD